MYDNLKERIKTEFDRGTLSFADAKAVCARCRVPYSDRKKVTRALSSLEAEGFLVRTKRGAYATPERAGAFEATVRGNERGFAFLLRDDGGNDLFVAHSNLRGAFDRDRVLAAPLPGGRDEAYVIRVLSRGTERVTGRFRTAGNAGYVTPDNGRFSDDLYVRPKNFGGAETGDKVLAEIVEFVDGKMPEGRVTEVLGDDGDFLTEELAVIRSAGLAEGFPEEAEREAGAEAERAVTAKGRRDMRPLLTVTIDGEDTRDMDDAVSLERHGGGYRLYVHIADVSEYVRRGSALDAEAYERGTSVYFPDRVLPMLPRVLSNGACSLEPGEDRYALTCAVEFDADGKRLGYDISESVIRSDARLTYGAVNRLFDGDGEGFDGDTAGMLRDMLSLSRALKARADARGAVNLDVREAKILFDGERVEIPDCSRGAAEDLIEQFMIAANEAVAEFAEKRSLPILYRVHEKPSPDKVRDLAAFAGDMGIRCRLDPDNVTPRDYAGMLSAARGKPFEAVLSEVALRSMQKARYSDENTGHFGLASERYCHFTSPIRRYPDLFTHRVVKACLRGKSLAAFRDEAGRAADQASERERTADQAERDVDDIYMCRYMEKHLGEEFDAVISGVASFGFFARLPNAVEGLVRTESLPEDDYVFYEKRLLLSGRRHSFRIGDAVRVRAVSSDFLSRRIDFRLTDGGEGRTAR